MQIFSFILKQMYNLDAFSSFTNCYYLFAIMLMINITCMFVLINEICRFLQHPIEHIYLCAIFDDTVFLTKETLLIINSVLLFH